MSPFRTGLSWLLISICALTGGCAGESERAQLSTAAPSATAATTITPPAISTPTLQPTPAEPTTLVIWIPESLLPEDEETLNALFEAEINEFVSSEGNIKVDVRRKSTQDVGGIMSMLRTASSVAPGALPDITLLRREDVLEAVENGLIQPLEGRIASAVIADLFPSALRLGRAEDQLYGLPYLLDIYLYAYRAAEGLPEPATFNTLIERNMEIAFPALHPNGISDVLWLQYAAGGGAAPEDGVLTLTPSVVSDILRFYEQLEQARLIVSNVDEYSTPSEYMTLLSDGRIDSGIVNTAILRHLADAEPSLKYAAVPTSDGQPMTLVNGWMWVIVTPNAERQGAAGRFLNWMMDASRLSTYAQAISMPPAQRSSLRRWHVDGIDNALFTEMLGNSQPLQPEIGANGAARALQAAWLDVISGRASAADATEDALEP